MRSCIEKRPAIGDAHRKRLTRAFGRHTPVVVSSTSGRIIRDTSSNGANVDPIGKLLFVEVSAIAGVRSVASVAPANPPAARGSAETPRRA